MLLTINQLSYKLITCISDYRIKIIKFISLKKINENCIAPINNKIIRNVFNLGEQYNLKVNIYKLDN